MQGRLRMVRCCAKVDSGPGGDFPFRAPRARPHSACAARARRWPSFAAGTGRWRARQHASSLENW